MFKIALTPVRAGQAGSVPRCSLGRGSFQVNHCWVNPGTLYPLHLTEKLQILNTHENFPFLCLRTKDTDFGETNGIPMIDKSKLFIN